MDATPREVLICQTDDEREPFSEWLDGLPAAIRGRVRVRIDRVEDGLLGEHKSVGKGVVELILDFDGGYRIYIGQIGNQVHLISGGPKKTQERDIKDAQDFWEKHE